MSEPTRTRGGVPGWNGLDPRVQWRSLVADWRLMLRPATIGADALAAVAVALVALPLSLAIAAASGVAPVVGLVTAVVGGLVVSMTGGSRLQVSGPAAAMTFLVYEIVSRFGMGGLAVVMILAGLMQILAGALRLGRFIQLMPRPVVAGFLSGIGLTILCTQLPIVLGYEIEHTDEGGALGLLRSTLHDVDRTQVDSLVVGLVAVAATLGLPRWSRRLPAPLIAIAVASTLPWLFGWGDLRLLGSLPAGFPAPHLPRIPWVHWNELVMAALAVHVLASLESLLSASVVDSLDKNHRTDNDQELIGQGLGNIASALFGGLPVTGVIARSATNVQAGGRTRLSCVLHALLLLAMMFALGPVVALIPRAALSGVLMAVAFRMIEVRLFRALWRTSQVEAAVGLVTAGAILVTDLIVGVPVGLLAAFVYIVYELSRLSVRNVPLRESAATDVAGEAAMCPSVGLIQVDGPLFFASGFHLRSALASRDGSRCLVIDLERVPFLDLTGVEILEQAVESLRNQGTRVLLARPSDAVFRRIRGLTQELFPALREAPVYGDLRDAFLHAATELEPAALCESCRAAGRCAAIDHVLGGVESLDRTAVPRVRAIVAWDDRPGGVQIPEGGADPAAAAGMSVMRDSVRPGPVTSWNRRPARPTIASSAFVDPLATVIGEVTVGNNVYIGPGVSVRADEGTPFFIGDESNLQDGVTLHALKGKVVLVHGRSYAIYVGRNVCITHHALVHGPCYIGDDCFIGFKSTVHDAVVGAGCVVGLGAVVVGVTLPPRRYVAHNVVIDSQEKAEALPEAPVDWVRLRGEVVEVNQELAAGNRQQRLSSVETQAARSAPGGLAG